MLVQSIDHVALATSDHERAIAWYTDVLGLERRHQEAWGDVPVMLCAGETCIAFFLTAEAIDTATPAGLRHLAFRVDRAGFIAAQERLRERGIAFEYADHDIAHSIYFEDPDGHQLEITTYDVG
jgi:catechol 2,3-dioxygenase-like lactoylglutathione lyase family enzyme